MLACPAGQRIACANWFVGCAAIGRCRSGRPVGPSVLTARRFTTSPDAPTARQGIAQQCPERDQAAIEKRIKQICETRVRYGYRRVHVLLDREGWGVNVKKVYRIYRELGMQLRNKTPTRRVKAKLPDDRAEAVGPNDVWAMDFVHDQLATGKKLRVLTVVDTFSRPGKPTDNAFIEAFNGRFRAECLNTHWFLTLATDAAEKLEAWRRYYNEERPHGAIGNKAPITLTKSGDTTSLSP